MHTHYLVGVYPRENHTGYCIARATPDGLYVMIECRARDILPSQIAERIRMLTGHCNIGSRFSLVTDQWMAKADQMKDVAILLGMHVHGTNPKADGNMLQQVVATAKTTKMQLGREGVEALQPPFTRRTAAELEWKIVAESSEEALEAINDLKSLGLHPQTMVDLEWKKPKQTAQEVVVETLSQPTVAEKMAEAFQANDGIPRTKAAQLEALRRHYDGAHTSLLAHLVTRSERIKKLAGTRLLDAFDQYGHSGLFQMNEHALTKNTDEEVADALNYLAWRRELRFRDNQEARRESTV